MGLLCFIYMICALRTNVVFFLIFVFLVPAFACLAAAYWTLAQVAEATIAGNTIEAANLTASVNKLLVAAGALTFVVDACGWWIFAAILLASLDFPFSLPGK